MVFKHQMDYVNSFDKSSPQLFTVPCLPQLEASNELKLAKRFRKIKQHIFDIQAKENCPVTWKKMQDQFDRGEHWIQKFSKRAERPSRNVFVAHKGNVNIQLEFGDWSWEDVTNNPMAGWGDFCGAPKWRDTDDFLTNIKPRRSYALTFYLNSRNLQYVDSRLNSKGYFRGYGVHKNHRIMKEFLHEAVSQTRLIKKTDDIFYWNGNSPMGTYYIETN